MHSGEPNTVCDRKRSDPLFWWGTTHPLYRQRESCRLLLDPLPSFIPRGANLCSRRSARRVPTATTYRVFANEGTHKFRSVTRLNPSEEVAADCHETRQSSV